METQSTEQGRELIACIGFRPTHIRRRQALAQHLPVSTVVQIAACAIRSFSTLIEHLRTGFVDKILVQQIGMSITIYFYYIIRQYPNI